jgi:hypothetical protein
MDEQRKKAFDFASEATKQLITLATGVIALTVTFTHDLIVGVPLGATRLLMAAWVLELVSIGCGVWTLLGLTGELEPASAHRAAVPSIRRPNVTVPSVLQISCFVLATALVVAFGIWATGGAAASPPGQ